MGITCFCENTVKESVFIPKLRTCVVVESHREYKTRLRREQRGRRTKKTIFPADERERSGQAARGEWGNQPTAERGRGEEREGREAPLGISAEEHSNVKRVNCVGCVDRVS